jgi:hypothetical protein
MNRLPKNLLPMNLLPMCRLQQRVFIFAAAFGLALLAAPMATTLAHAFTIDDQSNTNSDGSAKFADPTTPTTRFGSGGQTTIQQGNATLQFGPQRPSTDERYNKDRMFDPIGRPGDPDR